MKILLVSATKFEVNPTLKKLKKVGVRGNLTNCRLRHHFVDILITGVGMTATAFELGRCLNRKYDLAINCGVAGSFNRDIALGEVLNVVQDTFADLGAEDGEKFLTLKEMGLIEGKRNKAKVKRVNSLLAFKTAKAITVNTVHGNTASIRKVVKKFNPDIESMEGAAFFFACDQFKIPRIQLRAVSNYVERRNKKNWRLDLAIKNLNVSLEQLLHEI